MFVNLLIDFHFYEIWQNVYKRMTTHLCVPRCREFPPHRTSLVWGIQEGNECLGDVSLPWYCLSLQKSPSGGELWEGNRRYGQLGLHYPIQSELCLIKWRNKSLILITWACRPQVWWGCIPTCRCDSLRGRAWLWGQQLISLSHISIITSWNGFVKVVSLNKWRFNHLNFLHMCVFKESSEGSLCSYEC